MLSTGHPKGRSRGMTVVAFVIAAADKSQLEWGWQFRKESNNCVILAGDIVNDGAVPYTGCVLEGLLSASTQQHQVLTTDNHRA